MLVPVILAAGRGKRLKSEVPKPLVEIRGKPMITHILNKISPFCESKSSVVVINPDFENEFRKALDENAVLAYQDSPKGTADALNRTLHLVPDNSDILVMYSDLVLIAKDSLKSLVELHKKSNCDITFLSGITREKFPYALVERDERGRVVSFEERKIPDFPPPWEFYIGPIIIKKEIVQKYINKLAPNKETGEIYIADIVSLALADNKSVCGFSTINADEFLGVNTPEDLKTAEKILSD
ncbi:MAG: NTP transferase domain-containing protein [Kosmotogaceae bacterium]|nr:NTP transferase domain-containing protein [Kosmotogaceae bacterium]